MPDDQMGYLINEAREAIAQKGTEASDRQVMLACFGWLGEKLDRFLTKPNPGKPKNNDWKKWALIAGAFGAGASGGLTALWKLLGG